MRDDNDLIDAEDSAPKKSTYTPALARAQKKYNDRLREERRLAASIKWDFTESVNEKEARPLIAEFAQTKNQNVIDQCYVFGCQIAHDQGLITNSFYWSSGAIAMLAAKSGSIMPPEVEDGPGGRSEVLSVRELYALYSFSMAGRKFLGSEITFDQWLDTRDRGRKDLFWLARDVSRIPLVEEVHREITDNFYPKLNCDRLYPENYSLKDVHDAIAAQTTVKEGLLLDPRGYMKTALAACFVIQFFLNFPDARVFDISGTDDLALGFLRLVKIYLAKQADADPSPLHLLFPEYALHDIDPESEMPVTLPCRKHAQKDFSLWTAGVTSASSGAHCDLWLQDDCVQSEGSPDTRAKLANKIANLGNVPDSHALKIALGTRYHEEDAYARRIQLVEEDPTSMRYLCRGVWTVKTGYSHIKIEDLTLEMVDLLWPTQAGTPEQTFAALKRKLRINKADFMHQQLNVAEIADEGDNVFSFDLDVLNAHIIPAENMPKEGDTFLCVDVAHSTDARADYSVIVAGRIAKNQEVPARLSAHILHIDAKRRRSSALATDIAAASIRFAPKVILIEKLQSVELLVDLARQHAERSGHSLSQVYPVPISTVKDAKAKRIKLLEILLNTNRLWFADSCGDLPLAIDQFMRYDGKSNAHSARKKDDIPDCIAILCQNALPIDSVKDKNYAAMEKATEDAQAAQGRAAMYARIFSTDSIAQRPTASEPEPMNRGPYGIPGLKQRWTVPQTAPQMGFWSLKKKDVA